MVNLYVMYRRKTAVEELLLLVQYTWYWKVIYYCLFCWMLNGTAYYLVLPHFWCEPRTITNKLAACHCNTLYTKLLEDENGNATHLAYSVLYSNLEKTWYKSFMASLSRIFHKCSENVLVRYLIFNGKQHKVNQKYYL